MSTAKLNVWITEFSDPCHIMGFHEDKNSSTGLEEWYVHIVDCHGNPLRWCGRTYTFLHAKCGHLEVDIPPGCYAVFAGHNVPNAGRPPFGNRLTHIQVVRANCGDHVCVTLFSPDMWFCGTWFKYALETQLAVLETAKVDVKVARNAAGAVQAVLDQIKPTEFAANLEAFKKEAPAGGKT